MALPTEAEDGIDVLATSDRAQAPSNRESMQADGKYEPARHRQKNPYPAYATRRENEPVQHFRPLDGFLLTRHDDCLAVLRDSRFSNDARELRKIDFVRARQLRAGGDPGDFDNPSMLNLEGPQHARLRGLVNKGFTPREISALEPRIEGIADELLDSLRPGAAFDLMVTLANPLPAIVIAEMLGVPREDRAQFQAWSTDIVAGGTLDSRPRRRRANEARYDMHRYFRELIEVRRKSPQADILSALILVEEEDGDRLNLAELVAMCGLLLIAGHATVSAMIGNGVLTLLRNPDQLERLHASPELWPSAVEEMLRYECAIPSIVRIATEDLSIHGKDLRKGQTAVLMLAAANRDPEVFPDPDRFDIARSPNDHLSLGSGRHFCLGASLARLEIRIAVRALLRKFPQLDLATPDIEWFDGGVRTLATLPVRGGRGQGLAVS